MKFLPIILKPCAVMHHYGLHGGRMVVRIVASAHYIYMWAGFAGIYVRIVGTGHYVEGFFWFMCVCTPLFRSLPEASLT